MKKKTVFSFLSVIFVAVFALSACGGSKSSSSGGSTKTIDVALLDDGTTMSIEPASISVKEGTDLTLKVTNKGTQVHNLKLEDGSGTADLPANAAAELKVGKVTADSQLHCAIAGHKEQGMVLDLTVEK
ncbi:MAG: cupredoxin domain-containing protein [Acidimicrobiia bacterium]